MCNTAEGERKKNSLLLLLSFPITVKRRSARRGDPIAAHSLIIVFYTPPHRVLHKLHGSNALSFGAAARAFAAQKNATSQIMRSIIPK